MSKSFLQVDETKWLALKKQLGEISNAEVTIGIQSDAGTGESGTPIAAYAAYNEFGTNGGGWGGPIPARPFLGSTFDERRGAWGKAADIAIDRALSGFQSFERGLKQLGELAQRDIQDKILALDSPPNSPVTIAMKGSENPLIDTGAMRQAIRYEVKI